MTSFHINDERLLETYKAIWTKIEDLKQIKLNASPVYDDRYIKSKIRTYGDTNFCGLNEPEVDIEYESFTVISIDSLLSYENKYYVQVYLLDNWVSKVVNKRMTNYLDGNVFED